MIRRTWFWIVTLLILVAAATGSYYYYNGVYLLAQAPTETQQLQTAKVRRGDLTVSASGAGTLVALQEASIGFLSGGILVELEVGRTHREAREQTRAERKETMRKGKESLHS